MLVKMHACAVSVYQALSKEPGYEANQHYDNPCVTGGLEAMGLQIAKDMQCTVWLADCL